MYRMITLGIAAIIFAGTLQAQGQFSIRAASADPVAGWQRMAFDGRAVWVAPTVSVTADDIEQADPITDPVFNRAVAIQFTEAGAEKMRKLSLAQMDKLIA